MTDRKYTDSDLSAALAKGREEAAQLINERQKTLARVYASTPAAMKEIGKIRIETLAEVEQAIRALSPSSPGEPAGSGWQPIATAPKDGTRILMSGLNEAVRWICIGYYAPAHGATWVSDESFGLGPGKLQGPTDWMPLPAPPHEPTGET